jgi:predicted nucleotide-binding protein (sugar kinase/HSP70/actin superfamily)
MSAPLRGTRTNGQTSTPAAESGIEQLLQERRASLEKELGLEETQDVPYSRPEERAFTKHERPHTTLLIGGLTWKHEHLIHGSLEGLGYQCQYIDTPDVRAFQLGKEYGNNGQCNPTYFTVGSLVKHLQELEEGGLSRQEILDGYVFVTAGACGPCRFGMYEAEYRLALRNSGFDGFRVLLFQQNDGLNQSGLEAGLELNTEFFLGLINAFIIGDLLNDVAYQIRPFEVHEGETDRVLRECLDDMHDALRDRQSYTMNSTTHATLGRLPGLRNGVELLGKLFVQLRGRGVTDGLQQVIQRLCQVEVDRTRVKPIVKITGEFWAQTTEGDGNFNMFRFLEREGAQVKVENVCTFVTYIIHQYKQKVRDALGLSESSGFRRLAAALRQRRTLATLSLAEYLLRREWNRYRDALGGMPHELADQYELQRLGHPFYNSRAGGGEGYMEVAKNIYYHNKALAHMVLSLKPFGCMPSTQSDGAQSAVVNRFRDMIYLPLETSGEGEVNAHSRVQMALGEAKSKSKAEFEQVLSRTGFSLDQVREYIDAHAELKSGVYAVPRAPGVVGEAASFVHHVAQRMGYRPEESYDEPAQIDKEQSEDDLAAARALKELNKELVLVQQN